LIVGLESQYEPGSEHWEFRFLTEVNTFPEDDRTLVTWQKPLGSKRRGVNPPKDPGQRVYAMRSRAAVFGHNAPDWRSVPPDTQKAYAEPDAVGGEWPRFGLGSEPVVCLDRVYPEVIVHSWIVLVRPGYKELYRVTKESVVSCADLLLTAQVTRLELDTNENMSTFGRRETAVYLQSEELAVAERPISDNMVEGNVVTLSALVEAPEPGRPLMVLGTDQKGEQTGEVVKFLRAESDFGLPKFVFDRGLERSYDAATCTIFANVAPATHGVTVKEVLGGGDGSQARQRFVLKQPPLTWLNSSQPGGVESTLEVRVNDIKWHEVPYLYEHGADERVYVTRRRDDGTTVIEFGDGVTGARLPTGQENVTATYRKGIGLVGRMKPRQLSLLMTRPLGLKAAVNPLAALDGDDPEGLESARLNAPMKVLTLDRLVSLKDYEDFARSFAGVAKALATWTCTGRRRVIAVTVAGPDGTQIQPDGPTQDLYHNLSDALERFGDPFVPVALVTCRPALFRITGKVKRDPDYLWERVEAGLKEALRAGFSFGPRDLGQPVALSEVVAALQAVLGVVGVDIDVFDRISPADKVKTRLPLRAEPKGKLTVQSLLRAALPGPGPAGQGGILGAELLTVDPGKVDLVEMIEGAS